LLDRLASTEQEPKIEIRRNEKGWAAHFMRWVNAERLFHLLGEAARIHDQLEIDFRGDGRGLKTRLMRMLSARRLFHFLGAAAAGMIVPEPRNPDNRAL